MEADAAFPNRSVTAAVIGTAICCTDQGIHDLRADPRYRSVTVDLPTALLRDLLQLSDTDVANGEALDHSLTAVVAALQATIPSYRGISLALYQHDHPVTVTAFLPPQDGEMITTSLRVLVTALVPSAHAQSRIVFYASSPGAFVDLAADLAYLLRTAVHSFGTSATAEVADHSAPDGADGQHPIRLDSDLPPANLLSGLTGLDELTSINRAVGMLVAEGHHPDQARAILQRRAASAGVEAHVYAARLLRR